uniref:RNA helicase n=1 Tax=Blastobotrys adeninivorans TaxID=409370 RepID=A0A060T2C7_BLAAD
MGKYRKRFNEKARAGTVAKQEALKRDRQKHLYRDIDEDDSQSPVSSTPQDPNAEILLPVSKQEAAERKRKLAQDLNRDAPGISSKKRKRLDKYIDKQIRKQEKNELIDKLSKSQVDTSMLQSLKTLGSGAAKTKKQLFEEALRKERAGLGDETTRAILYEEREVKDWRDSEEFRNLQTDEVVDNGKKKSNGASEAKTVTAEDQESDPEHASTFIDHRSRGPAGFNFSFQGLKEVSSSKPSSGGLTWRQKVAVEKARKYKKDLEFDNEEDSEDSGSDESGSEDSGSEEVEDLFDNSEASDSEDNGDEDDAEEWNGFSDAKADDPGSEESESHSGLEEESEPESESSDGETSTGETVSKGQAFKEWASQWTETSTRTEEGTGLDAPEFKGEYIPLDRPEDRESPPPELMVNENPETQDRKAYVVDVNRAEDIQRARLQLPVVNEEQRIMEAIHNNDCIVICGETGSGKTTQVPQFLFEAGYGSPDSKTPGMVGITQPRRVAAVSMAKRVGAELGDHGNKVGYQIRFDATVNKDTAIKFMTDGVLLRELSVDLTLSKYSAIIIDEAHERNINTDILIGVLSRVLKLRKDMSKEENSKVTPLKIIIMSATLRVSDFTENTSLFPTPPPVLNVEARQYPVSIHFNRRTHFNYLDQVYDKVVKIHQRLPRGGILIFLTGQNEITHMCRRLRQKFPKVSARSKEDDVNVEVRISGREAVTEAEDVTFGIEDDEKEGVIDDEFDDITEEEEEEEEGFDEVLEEGQTENDPLHVLPLYSLLPTKEQMKVFQDPPKGSRLCVVATNVAETSLTIPGIRYVVDCGRAKERHYDEDTGVQSFKVGWTSKASANQRAGRAGRTGPGHCYRVYSSAVYERDFEQFTKPEILRMPVEGVILQMKAMGIHNILKFPFPTPPPQDALKKGLQLLRYLEALDSRDAITDHGLAMSYFPLSPRFARMLLIGHAHKSLAFVIALVSGLTVGEPFISEQELNLRDDDGENEDEDLTVEEREFKRKMRSDYFKCQQRFMALDPESDAMKLLSAIGRYDYEQNKEAFSQKNFLRYKQMEEIAKLREQLVSIVLTHSAPGTVKEPELRKKLGIPSAVQKAVLKQVITAGFIDQVAIRADYIEEVSNKEKSRTVTFPYLSLFPSQSAYGTEDTDEEPDKYVYIHPSSVLAYSGEAPPRYLVFKSMNRGESRGGRQAKVRIKPLTSVSGKQLTNVGKSSPLITFSKPLNIPTMLSASKRRCQVVPRMGATIGSGGVGWDLPPMEVEQEKEGVQWVVKQLIK